jgi:type I restriction enzyme S subunit
MSVAWPTVRLGDVLVRSWNTIPLNPETMYKEVTVRMSGKGVVERRQVQGIEIASDRRFKASAGQFIISRIDARNGASGLIPEELDGAVVTNDFPLFDVAQDRIDPAFLGWMAKTASFVELCKRASEGTTNRVRLSEERFKALEVALPPPDEQRRIVAQIEELARKVEEAMVLRQQSDQAMLAFVAATHTALASSPPEPLCNFLDLHEEVVPIEIGVPYPQVGVRGFGGGLFAKPPVLGGQTTYRSFNRLYSSALVMSQVKGWEGAIAVTPPGLEGFFVSPEYRTFRCKEVRCLPEYLAAIVPTEFFWGRLKDATRGVGARRERTRPEQFLQLSFSMPSLSDQHRAVAMFAMIPEIRSVQRDTDAELDALLPAILDKAFKGDL